MNRSLCILIKPKIWLILKRRREPPLLRVTEKSANRGRTSWRSFAKLSRKSYSSRNQWSGRFYSKVTTARSLVTFPARKCGFHSWDAGFSTVRDQTKGFLLTNESRGSLWRDGAVLSLSNNTRPTTDACREASLTGGCLGVRRHLFAIARKGAPHSQAGSENTCTFIFNCLKDFAGGRHLN